MKRSTDRILTTHTGSLVRPPEIVQLMRRLESGEAVEEAGLSTKLRGAVAAVVKQQADTGIDIPSDGEFGKRGWTSYVSERLGGLESFTAPYSGVNSLAGAEIEHYRGFYEMYNRYERTLWLPDGLDTPTTSNAPSTGWR